MRSIYKLLIGFIAIFTLSSYIAPLLHVSVPVVAGGLASAALITGLSPVPAGALKGVLVELWTGELINHFRHVGKWLSEIPSANNYVNNNVIHLVDVGADPDVLINNTSYPIASAQRDDQDIAVALKKFDTTNTKITDDELYALPYDKQGSVLNQHRETLEERTSEYGLHSLAPAANSASTPIVLTTGGNNGSGRKRMKVADITTLKTKLDELKLPKIGRILVLCTQHVNDLLMDTDQTFRDRFYNTKSGEVLDFLGFKIYEDVYNPVYNGSVEKKAFGAAAAPSTDRPASVAFYAPRTFKAMGSVKMYYASAAINPKFRETEVGFRLYHIVLPKKALGFGAIVSAMAEGESD